MSDAALGWLSHPLIRAVCSACAAHGNCEFNANSYVPGFRGTGMMLAACQAISLPDGTFLTSAVVCWDVSHA